jgi:hypothetical protein
VDSRREDQTQTKVNERIRRSESKEKKGLPGDYPGAIPSHNSIPLAGTVAALWFTFLAFAKFAALLH